MVLFPCALNDRTHRWLSMAMATAVLALADPAHAAYNVNVGSVTAAPGSTGDSFDVTLTNTGPSAINLGAFAFEVTVTGTAVTFTGVTDSTALLYIFAGSSLAGPNITNNLSAQDVSAEDLTTLSAGVPLGVGSTVGLGHVLFNVAPGAALGPITVTPVAFPDTNLSDFNGNNIALGILSTGTITIQNAETVPAPSSLLMGLIAATLLIAVRRLWPVCLRG